MRAASASTLAATVARIRSAGGEHRTARSGTSAPGAWAGQHRFPSRSWPLTPWLPRLQRRSRRARAPWCRPLVGAGCARSRLLRSAGRGREQSEGLASSFGMLVFTVSWPVIAVGATAIIFLIFGFPQCRVRHHDASPPPEHPRFHRSALPDMTVSPSVYSWITLRKPVAHFMSRRRDLLVHGCAIFSYSRC